MALTKSDRPLSADWPCHDTAGDCYNEPMLFPDRLPGLRVLTALGGIYAAVWISLEGSLQGVILMAVSVAALTLAHGARRVLGGRSLRRPAWLGAFGLGGLALGIGAAGLTLLFMAVKTGLHGHGPEFSPTEINWVISQAPLWAAAGLTGGLGLGLLLYRPAPEA